MNVSGVGGFGGIYSEQTWPSLFVPRCDILNRGNNIEGNGGNICATENMEIYSGIEKASAPSHCVGLLFNYNIPPVCYHC